MFVLISPLAIAHVSERCAVLSAPSVSVGRWCLGKGGGGAFTSVVASDLHGSLHECCARPLMAGRGRTILHMACIGSSGASWS
eukprot:4225430-Alexandrium_andersonii.AAC.1